MLARELMRTHDGHTTVAILAEFTLRSWLYNLVLKRVYLVKALLLWSILALVVAVWRSETVVSSCYNKKYDFLTLCNWQNMERTCPNRKYGTIERCCFVLVDAYYC